MTCIVGVEHGGRVYIGGDSFAGGDGESTAISSTKVYRTGPYLLAHSHLLASFTKVMQAAGLQTRERFREIMTAYPGRDADHYVALSLSPDPDDAAHLLEYVEASALAIEYGGDADERALLPDILDLARALRGAP